MNKTLDILNPSGQLIRRHTLSVNCTRRFSLMSEDSITLRFSEREAMRFPVGTSIGNFFITQEQVGKWNESTGVWEYELKFDAYYWAWKNKILRYVIPGIDSAKETSFLLTGPISLHAQVIKNCLDLLGVKYDNSPFYIATDETVSNEAKLVRYENISILGGIQAIAEAFECEWWVSENAIHFGRCENNASQHVFEAGLNTSSITWNNAKSEAPNRLYVYGSDRNLPSNYRKVDGNDTIGGVVVRRLMLPEGTPYLQTRPDIPESEIVEKVVTLDSVYPRTDLIVSDEPETYTSQVEDDEGNATTETFYRLKYGDDFRFSESYVLPDKELHIVFQSGLLNGMDFGAKFNPKGLNEKNADGSWNPLAQMIEIVANEDYGRKLPDDVLKPKKRDKFILYGWDSTKMADLGLIANAEQELLEEGQKALEEYAKDLSSCTCPMAWDYMKPLFETNSQPKPGDVVTIIDTAHFGESGRKSRIIGFEYKLDKPYAEWSYTCGENVSVSRLASIEQKIDGLAKSGTKVQTQNSLDFLSKRYNDRTPYRMTSDTGFDVGDFVSGVSGARLAKDAETGQTYGELDRLFVRVRAYFESLTVIETEALAGEQMITPGGGVECTGVEAVYNDGFTTALSPGDRPADALEGHGALVSWRCYFLSEQDGEKRETKIIAGDQAIAQTFNAKTGTQNKVSNHRWWRLVTAVSNDAYTDDSGNRYGYIEVSASDCESGSDAPQSGDEIVQFGNRTDATRQTAMVFSTVDSDAPSVKLFNGIGGGATNAEHYSLDGRAIVSFGYDHSTSQVYFRLGTSTATQYLQYTQTGGLEVAGKISTLSTIDGKSVEDYIKQVAPEFDDDELRVLIGYAQGAAEDAQDAADKAQADATDAAQAASDAQTSADSAQSAADAAQSTANSAYSKASAAEAAADAYKYLKENLLNALSDNTQIAGGLILSTMLALGYTEGETRHILSGMNGSYNSDLGGRTPAAWYGGNMVDRFDKNGLQYATPPANAATSMIRMDGSAYFAKGNVGFNTDGSGWFGDRASGQAITFANGSMTFGSGIVIDLGGGKTDTFQGLNNTLTSLVNAFNSFDLNFTPMYLDANGNPQPTTWGEVNKGNKTLWAVRSAKGFYSEEFISARGLNAFAQTGNVGLDETQLAQYLTANGYAKLTDIPSAVDLTPYALKSELVTSSERTLWNQTASDLSAILGSDTNGVIDKWNEITAFLDTYTEADTLANLLSNKADVTALDGYLPLTGGTLTGNLTIGSGKSLIVGTGSINPHTGGGIEIWANGTSNLKMIMDGNTLYPFGTGMLGTPTNRWTGLFSGIFASTVNVSNKLTIGDCEITWDADNGGLRFSKGIYSEEFVSARGVNANGMGSGGTIVGSEQLAATLADYALKTWVQDNYQPKGSYVTSVAWGDVTGKPAWIGSSKPSYAFSELTSHPTTLAGYGITDAKIEGGVITLGGNTITPLTSLPAHSHSEYLTSASLNGYMGFERGDFDPNALTGIGVRETTFASNGPNTNLWHQYMSWGTADANYGAQFANNYNNQGNLYFRQKTAGTWGAWKTIVDSSNIGSYAITAHQSLANYVTLDGAQTISGVKTLGNRVSSTAPATDSEVNRLIITPYYHTGGPWYLTSLDNSTNAYLRIKYGNNAVFSFRHDGVLDANSFVKRGGTSSQILMADGSVKNFYVSSDVTSATSEDGTITPLAMNNWTTARFVKKAGDTMTGVLQINADIAGSMLILNQTGNKEPYLYLYRSGNAKAAFTHNVTYGSSLYSSACAKYLGITDAGIPHFQGNTLWHSGNDGSGSGLDADLLDGRHAGGFAWRKGLGGQTDSKGAYAMLAPAYNGTILSGGYFYGSVYITRGNATSYNAKTEVRVQCGGQYSSNIARYQILSASVPIAGLYKVIYNGTAYIALKMNATSAMYFAIEGLWEGIDPFIVTAGDSKLTSEEAIATTPNISSNADSATKLLNTRTIWGQNFNGEGNVSGNMTGVGTISASINDTTTYNVGYLQYCPNLAVGRTSHIEFGKNNSKYNTASIHHYHAGDGSSNNGILFCGHSVANLMFIRYDGNVGIGTTAPAYKLDVLGSTRFSSSVSGAGGDVSLELWRGTNASWRFLNSGGNLYIQNNYTSAVTTYFDVVQLNYNNGYVGIGNAPSYKLDVTGDIRASEYVRCKLVNINGGGIEIFAALPYIDFHYNNTTTDYNVRLINDTSGQLKCTGVFYSVTGIWSDGYVSARGQNTSDARLKTNIRDFDASAIIRSISPKAFQWNAMARSRFKALDTDDTQYGLIAQDTLRVAPWLVDEDMFGDGLMGVHYHKLIPVLTKATKELYEWRDLVELSISYKKAMGHEERIKALEEENKELKRKIEILERR